LLATARLALAALPPRVAAAALSATQAVAPVATQAAAQVATRADTATGLAGGVAGMTDVGAHGAGGVLAYLGLSVGPILTEELAPILAGVAVAEGRLHLVAAIVVMTLGGWVATALLYAFGRWRGRWVRRRFPRAGRVIKGLLRAVRRRPWRSAIAVRFAFGARILLPLACGAAHVRPDVYLIGSLVSSITWTTLFAFVGYWFGRAALDALHRVRQYNSLLAGVGIGFVVLAVLWVRRRRRLAAARDGQAPEAPLPAPPGAAS
jgi:membrane protein DedA with SNARE-associated domain